MPANLIPPAERSLHTAKKAEDFLDKKAIRDSMVKSQDWGRVHLADSGDDPIRTASKKAPQKPFPKKLLMTLAAILFVSAFGFTAYTYVQQSQLFSPKIDSIDLAYLFPENYTQCLEHQGFEKNQLGGYGCEILVETDNGDILEACIQLGGELIQADSASSDCVLRYYREDLSLPQNYEQCVLSAEGEMSVVGEVTVPRCSLDVNTVGSYAFADYQSIIGSCPAEAQTYEEGVRCQVSFERDTLALPGNYPECLLAGGSLIQTEDKVYCENRFSVLSAQNYSLTYGETQISGNLFEECWFGAGHPSADDKGFDICSLRFDQESGELISFTGQKGPLPQVPEEFLSIEFSQPNNRIVSGAEIIEVTASSSLLGAYSPEQISVSIGEATGLIAPFNLESFENGRLEILAEVVGETGKRLQKSVELILDKTPPQIRRAEVISCSADQANVLVEIADDQTVVVDVFVTQAGREIFINRLVTEKTVTSQFTVPVTAETLDIRATDGAGNVKEGEMAVGCGEVGV